MNNRIGVFCVRNIKEMLRSPVSWVFGLCFPIGIFLIMQIVIKSIGAEAASFVPMFAVDRFTCGISIFGGAFLAMFCAMLISGDRAKSFLPRLFASPMRGYEFLIGYAVCTLPLAVVQNAAVFVVAACFGLTLSVNIIPAFLFSVAFSVLFTAIGVLFGSLLGEKSVPGVCSGVVQVAALLSGMWFDLQAIGGGFEIFCKVLPFAHYYDIIRFTLAGDYGKVWLPIIIVIAYTAVFAAAGILVFNRNKKRG